MKKYIIGILMSSAVISSGCRQEPVAVTRTKSGSRTVDGSLDGRGDVDRFSARPRTVESSPSTSDATAIPSGSSAISADDNTISGFATDNINHVIVDVLGNDVLVSLDGWVAFTLKELPIDYRLDHFGYIYGNANRVILFGPDHQIIPSKQYFPIHYDQLDSDLDNLKKLINATLRFGGKIGLKSGLPLTNDFEALDLVPTLPYSGIQFHISGS